MIWNIILTLTVCLVLAFPTAAMILSPIHNEISKDEDMESKIIVLIYIISYIILISLVFANIISLGKLALIIIVVYVILYIIHSNKDKLFD